MKMNRAAAPSVTILYDIDIYHERDLDVGNQTRGEEYEADVAPEHVRKKIVRLIFFVTMHQKMARLHRYCPRGKSRTGLISPVPSLFPYLLPYLCPLPFLSFSLVFSLIPGAMFD